LKSPLHDEAPEIRVIASLMEGGASERGLIGEKGGIVKFGASVRILGSIVDCHPKPQA